MIESAAMFQEQVLAVVVAGLAAIVEQVLVEELLLVLSVVV